MCVSEPVGLDDWVDGEADCVGLPETLTDGCEPEAEAVPEWLPVRVAVWVGTNERLGDREGEPPERDALERVAVSLGVGGGSDAVAVPVGVRVDDWDREAARLGL